MKSLLGFILLCFAISAISGTVTAPAVDNWYSTLIRPSFAPPNYLFGPVWVVLYLMIAISGWLVWKKENIEGKKAALGFYFAQLALNFAWSFIFFGAKAIGLAAIGISFLWLFILLTTIRFFKISKVAGWLLIPYLGWVSFATVLNFAYWNLN